MSTHSLLSASLSTSNSRLLDEHPSVADPIAAERWNVEKKRIEIDAEIEAFYNAQVAKCINIENISNKKAVKLYNDLFYKIKWSNPPIPAVHGRLMIAYCGHLLNVGSKIPFENEVDMHVWSRKAKGTNIDKITMECTGMCNRMFKIIDKRDSDIAKTQLNLLDTTDKMNIKKDGTLRFMMEKNHNARDNYFSIWYLATHNKTRELGVLLTSASKMAQYDRGVDTPDPDFGLTALLYAVKHDHWNAFQLLLQHGANFFVRAPDGRTALHYAAAYSSKEMVLELLGLGLGYEATDNYGCTALDLAKQNVNKRTYPVLLNWNHLVPAVSNDIGNEGVASFMYAGSAASNSMNPSEYLISKGIGFSRTEPSVTFTTAAPEEKPLLIENTFNLEAGESFVAEPAPLNYTNEEINMNLENSFVYPIHDSSNSMGMYVPDEYTMTPETTIEQMSPMLRLLTKRLEACNKFVDPRARTGRVEESATYFLKRSVVGMDLIQQSMSETLSRSSQVLAQQVQQLQMSRSTSALPTSGGEINLVASVESLPLMETAAVEPALNTEETKSAKKETINEETILEQREDSQVLEEPPGSAVLDQPTQSQAESGWPTDDVDGVDGQEGENGDDVINPAEQFLVNTASTMKLIEQEVHECLIEIRQCTKHYHMCVREGFLLEALRSLRRRWLVSKELLVLHGRKEQFLMEEWTTLHQAASLLDDEEEQMPQLESSTLVDVAPVEASAGAVNDSQTAKDTVINGNDDEHSGLFHIRTNEEESAANILLNSQYDRVDLGRLALNFEASLKRVVMMPDLENDMFEHKEEADGLKNNSIASNQYMEERRWGRVERSDLPMDTLHVSEVGPMKSVTSSSSSEVASPQNKKISKAFKSSVRYIDGGYEQVTEVAHSSYEPTGSAATEGSDDKSVVSRGVVTSNLSKDVLKLGEHSNIYYEAAEYVNKMKEHRNISALELIHAINEQAMNRRLIYQPNKSSTAPSTTITATQSQARDDALSISSRGDTITTTFTTAAESIVSNFGKSQISVRYLLTQGLELCDTHLTRREEGSALKVLEECCLLLDPASDLSRTTNDVDATMKIKLLTRKCDLLLSIYRYLVGDTHLKSTSASREIETERSLSMWRSVQYQPVLQSSVEASLTVSGPGGEVVCSDPGGWDCNLLMSGEWIRQNVERILNNRREREEAAELLRQQQREQQLLLESENPIAPPPSLASEPSLNAASMMESEVLVHEESAVFVKNEGSSVIELMSGQGSFVDLEESQVDQPAATATGGDASVVNDSTTATGSEEAMLAAEQEELSFFEQLQQHRDAVLDDILSRIVVAAKLSIHLHHELYSHDIVEPFTLAQALQFIAFVHDYRTEGPESLVFMQHAEIVAVRSLGGGSEETIKVALESLRLFVKYYLISQEDLKYFYGKCNEVLRFIKEFSRINIKAADALNKTCTELLALSTIIVSGGGVFDPAQPRVHKKLTISACNNQAIMKKYSTSTYRKQFFPFKK